MIETSLIDEYQKLSSGVTKIFVLPKIPGVNRNTSYLYQLYKDLFTNNFSIKIETFDAVLLPKIFFSRLKSEKTILHYHWFEFEDLKSFIGIIWKLFWIILYKILGGKIIWTIHNRYPHPNKYLFLNIKFRKLFAGAADKLHVHCISAIELVKDILKVKEEKFFIVKHPDFVADIFEKEKAIEKLNEKYFGKKLDNNDKIFLMFGAIAEYKGIKEVVRIFERMGRKDKLIVAGFIKRGNQNYFNELEVVADAKKVFIEGSLIPEEDVPFFLNSADYVIFNYRDILTSGGVILAVNYNKKIIVPSMGCVDEINYPDFILYNRKLKPLEQILLPL